MKLYVVFGIEYHVGRELLGYYIRFFFAICRMKSALNWHSKNGKIPNECE